MKKIIPFLLLLILADACNQIEELQVNKQANPISKTELNKIIWTEVKQTGAFDWNKASDMTVWSALQASDNVLSVGFKPENEGRDISQTIHQIDINTGTWKTAKEKVLALILEEERKLNPALKLEELQAFQENTLPIVDVYVKNTATIQKLRSSNLVRYAEPMGYEPENDPSNNQKSSSGCGGYDPDNGLVAGSDYTNITPTAKASWNHPFHNIASAWNKTTGAGIKMMIIDTGSSPTQDNLGSQFNQGFSSGRTIERVSTLRNWALFGNGSYQSPDDQCGHGTAMSGVAVAPRGTDGNAAGIAYNTSLVIVRATADVLIDESRETKGVTEAFTLAGNRPDIRIISMSLGRITSSSSIADAVRYAYNNGKLIFCAGGTSFGWTAGWYGVIFPATMNEVNAVTGVKDNNQRCDDCHDGSQIDFTVVMEKASNGRHPITTATTGNQPGTVGGSSVATAQTAGMAALVWAKNPSFSRDQVLNKLTTSASYYPNKNGNFGWGNVNVDLATN